MRKAIIMRSMKTAIILRGRAAVFMTTIIMVTTIGTKRGRSSRRARWLSIVGVTSMMKRNITITVP